MKIKSPALSPIFLLLIFIQVLAQTSQPRPGGSVVIAVNTDPGGLNPAITTQGGVHLVCGSIFSGLVGLDFNLKPTPDLATAWEVSPASGASAGGQRYVFHLAPNATFHDGQPVTSADVKFTFEQMLLKYHSRTRTSIGDKLKAISTPDAHTVVFEFGAPYAAFLQLIDVANAPVLPRHLYENTDPLTNPNFSTVINKNWLNLLIYKPLPRKNDLAENNRVFLVHLALGTAETAQPIENKALLSGGITGQQPVEKFGLMRYAQCKMV